MYKVKYILSRDAWRTIPTLPMPRPNRRKDGHELQLVPARESFNYQTIRDKVVAKGFPVKYEKVR